MASVIVTPTARRNLETLMETHSLPASTLERFKRTLAPLRLFPLMGAQLPGRWARFRFILGAWRWMIVIYGYDEVADEVRIIAIQDGRSARSPSR